MLACEEGYRRCGSYPDQIEDEIPRAAATASQWIATFVPHVSAEPPEKATSLGWCFRWAGLLNI